MTADLPSRKSECGFHFGEDRACLLFHTWL